VDVATECAATTWGESWRNLVIPMLTYCLIIVPWLACTQVTQEASLRKAQEADLKFGQAQLEQFMRDRPEVRHVLIRQVALRNQLERGFGGLETGFRVYWDNGEPEVREADYRQRHGEEPARIRVSKSPFGSGSDKCVTLLIELEHAKGDNRGTAIRRMAYFGQMSREDYARSMTHIEFQSVQRAREFFKQHPLPPSEGGSDYKWLLQFPTEFSEYLKSLSGSDDPDVNLVEYYRQSYDKLVSQRKYDMLKMIPSADIDQAEVKKGGSKSTVMGEFAF
jgi:hypothetical protein